MVLTLNIVKISIAITYLIEALNLSQELKVFVEISKRPPTSMLICKDHVQKTNNIRLDSLLKYPDKL